MRTWVQIPDPTYHTQMYHIHTHKQNKEPHWSLPQEHFSLRALTGDEPAAVPEPWWPVACSPLCAFSSGRSCSIKALWAGSGLFLCLFVFFPNLQIFWGLGNILFLVLLITWCYTVTFFLFIILYLEALETDLAAFIGLGNSGTGVFLNLHIFSSFILLAIDW